MKKLIRYLKDHLKEDFDPITYLVVILFLAITVTINYIYDFEDSVIDSYRGREIRFLWYFLFYFFAYFFVIFLYAFRRKSWTFLKNKKFLATSIAGLGILSFDAGFHYHYLFAETFFPQIESYAFKCFCGFNSIYTILIPLFLIHASQKNSDGFYGLAGEILRWSLWCPLCYRNMQTQFQ